MGFSRSDGVNTKVRNHETCMYSPCIAKDWRLSEGVTCVMQFDMLHVWEDGSMCGWIDGIYINRDGQLVLKFIPPACRISRYTLTLFSRYQSRKYHAPGTIEAPVPCACQCPGVC